MNCELKFLRNVNGVFYSGSLLEASVEVNLTEPVRINEVICKFIGFAKCEWSTHISHYNLQVHTSRIDYLDHKMNVLDNGIDLESGTHGFEFSYLLPPTLPTSFKSKYASIKYKMQVDVKFENLSQSELFFELPFVIIHPFNLNMVEPSLAEPVKVELMKSFNFNIASNDISMMVVIPQGGYIAGQSVELLIQVENNGKSRVKYMKIRLKRILNLTCYKPKITHKKVSTNEVKETIYHEVAPKTKRDYLRCITIPPIPPNIENCEIIQVSYELHVKAKTIGWNKSPVIKIPILIGTIPIVNDNLMFENIAAKGISPPSYEDTFYRNTATDTSSDEDDD